VIAFTLVFGTIAIATALSFGLGGRRAAERITEDRYERQQARRPKLSVSMSPGIAQRAQRFALACCAAQDRAGSAAKSARALIWHSRGNPPTTTGRLTHVAV